MDDICAPAVRRTDTYNSFGDWSERGPYAANVIERRLGGEAGFVMLEAIQPCGDGSDPALPDLTLVMCRAECRGEGDFGAGRWRGAAPADSFVATLPGSPSQSVVHRPQHLRVFSIPRHVVDTALQGTALDYPDFGVLHARPFADSFLKATMDRLWLVGGRSLPSSRLFVEAAGLMVVSTLMRLSEVPIEPVSGGLAPRLLKRVTEYLDAHLAEDTSLSELAAIADLSSYHFCRAFKQSTGLPPHAWLTARRIKRAQELIAAHPKMGLTEIALAVGYQSQAAFGVAFRRATGSTPRQWRRERAG